MSAIKLMGTKYELGPSFAVSETGRIRMRDSASVKDSGAIGDGVADDTAAFASAQTTAGTDGHVTVPPGTYKLTSVPSGYATYVMAAGATFSGPSYPRRVFKYGLGGLYGRGTLIGTYTPWLESERTGTENNADLIVKSCIGQTGALGASRTSDWGTAGSMGCIGVQAWAINDNASQVQTAYGLYAEARRKSGAGNTHGIEVNIGNYGSVGSITPYSPFGSNNLTAALWVASGGEFASADASVAIGIINNGRKFDKGIVFHQTALVGSDGNTGTAVAISMAKGHMLQWLSGSTGTEPLAMILSDVTSSSVRQKLLFSDIGTLVRNGNDKNILQIYMTDSHVNGVVMSGAGTGSAPQIAADGDNTNIDLKLTGKGTGVVDIAGTVAGSAGSSAGYVTVKISGVSYKLQVFSLA